MQFVEIDEQGHATGAGWAPHLDLEPMGAADLAKIKDVLGVGRTAIWRTRKAYLEGGLLLALHDVPRPGKPRRYGTEVEAQVSALACSAPPAGAKRWTLDLLEQAAQRQAGMVGISRQTIRRLLKKTASNPGAG
jgi:transposase